MRWFARPEGDFLQLRVAPELDFWEVADHPGVVRLRAYLDDTEALLADSKVQGPWALRLDVGRPADRDLLDKADLDNYAAPLAKRLRDANLVSVWCTKEHRESSYVRVDAAREVPAPPPTEVLVVETTASWNSNGNGNGNGSAAQRQLIDAVAHANVLPPGPVRLELSFVVGPGRTWPNLWKPAIDSLDSLLGRTYADKPRNPLDGRITELGLHVEVDPSAGNKVLIGIRATPGTMRVSMHSPGGGETARTDQPGSVNSLAGMVDSSNGTTRQPVAAKGEYRPAASPRVGSAREFRDDDAGYLAWRAKHPDGYVINIGRGHSPAGARVHRVRCGHMSREGVATEGQYVKVCADSLADLEQWAADVVRGSIARCGACNPRPPERAGIR